MMTMPLTIATKKSNKLKMMKTLFSIQMDGKYEQ